MARRLSLFAFACLFLAGVTQGTPAAQLQVRDTEAHVQGATTVWSSCGDPSDPVKIKYIKVNPDPPKPGQNMTVTVGALVEQTIEDGAYIDVVVKIGVIQLLKKTFDLCEEARNAEADIQCPVKEGEYEITQTVELPKEIPPAKFVVTADGYNADDSPMACVKIEVDFRKGLLETIRW